MISTDGTTQQLRRTLGSGDAVIIGLSAMIGAGIFAALAPAAGAAGSGLLVSLAVAAIVAYCNATSSARLAALYPQSGGTYVYGRKRLGPFWGYLAGWNFVVGKTASCAAMAMTVAAYAAPAAQRWIAVAVVIAMTAVTAAGVQKATWVARIIISVTLLVLLGVVASGVRGQHAFPVLDVAAGGSPFGILQAAAILFFAFAGYARIATLGEEVNHPHRTIPRAIAIALTITLVVYAAVAAVALAVVGPARLAASSSPLQTVVQTAGVGWMSPVVRVAAALAAAGALLAMLLGVSRTTLAMGRDGYLPRPLGTVSPRAQTPRVAVITIGAVVAVVVAVVDLRTVIGFSSFGVLIYYGIANASAFTLGPRPLWNARVVPILGVLLCLTLVACVPWQSAIVGVAVLAAGIAGYFLITRLGSGRTDP